MLLRCTTQKMQGKKINRTLKLTVRIPCNPQNGQTTSYSKISGLHLTSYAGAIRLYTSYAKPLLEM